MPNDDDILGGVADGAPPAQPRARGGGRISPDAIVAAAQAAGVDPGLYARLIHQESGGQIGAASKKGAVGPAQLMPKTAADLGVDPNDPIQNVQGGARYLRQLLDRYGGDQSLALAAYNAGPDAVDKAHGVPNIPETQNYVRAIMGGAEDDILGGVADAPAPQGATTPTKPGADPFTKAFGGLPDASTDHVDPNRIPIVDSTGKRVGYATPAQSDTVRGLLQAGRYDLNAPEGSETHPYAYPAGQRPVRGGTWYLDADNGGKLTQYKDPDSPLATADQLGRDIANPLMIGLNASGVAPMLGAKTDPRAQAMESGFASGVLFGGKNELASGIEAMPGLFNGQGYTNAFTQALAANDTRDEALRARFPLAHDASAAAGGLSSAVTGDAAGSLLASGLARAAPEAADFIAGNPLLRVPATLARRGAVGAGYGSAQGYLAGGAGVGEAQREEGARQGAIAGTVFGEGLPLLGDTAGALGRAFAPKTAADQVVNKVANALQNAASRDGIAPSDLITTAKANPTAPAFHAGGPNIHALADAAANAPGPAMTTVRGAIANHMADAPAQVKADIGTALGGQGNYLDTLDQTIGVRREVANRSMAAIEGQPVTLNENSVMALRSPMANAAVKRAAQVALSSFDPAEREAGANLNRIADTVLDNPSAATMTVRNAQDISRSLLTAASNAYKGGEGDLGGALKGLGRAIRGNASDANPAYAKWLKQYGDDSDNLDALQMGHSVFSNAADSTAAAMAKTLKGMSAAAQDYYRKGVAEALIDKSRQQGGVQTMRALLRNEDVRDKVRAAFPDQASYDQFIKAAERRVIEHNANAAIIGGSPTGPRLAARADLESQPTHPLDIIPHALEVTGHVFTGNAPALYGKALKTALKNIPRQDRSVIGDPQANALLGQAMVDPATMERLLTTKSNPLTANTPRPNPVRAITPLAIRGVNLLTSPPRPIQQGPTAIPVNP